MQKNIQVIKDIVSELGRRGETIQSYKNLEDFVEFFKSLQRLIKTQKALQKKEDPPVTAYDITRFHEWLSANNYKHSGKFDIHNFGAEQGNGLIARKEIKPNELFMEIPVRVTINEETARKSKIGEFLTTDILLKQMPNVGLALHLLLEKLNPNSFWAPYIKLLPRSYSTPLYYTYEELAELQGSVTLGDCLKMIVGTVRNYCYIFNYFLKNPHLCSIISFTYAEFIWATSCTMSRQNRVFLTPEGIQEVTKGATSANDSDPRPTLALIPMWDFANHEQGKITTEWAYGTQKMECRAMRTFKKGEQIFIHYGDRPNLEFFVYSGFVYANNVNDVNRLRMTVNEADTAQKPEKVSILTALGFNNGEVVIPLTGRYIPHELLVFAAVLLLPTEDVTKLKAKADGVNVEDIPSVAFNLGREYLKEKISFWLAAYPTTVQEDAQRLSSGNVNLRIRNAIQYRQLERQIFQNTVDLLDNKERDVVSISTIPEINREQPTEAPEPTATAADTTTTTEGGAAKKKKKNKKKAKKPADAKTSA